MLLSVVSVLLLVWVLFTTTDRRYVVYENEHDEAVKVCWTYKGADYWVKHNAAEGRCYIRFE